MKNRIFEFFKNDLPDFKTIRDDHEFKVFIEKDAIGGDWLYAPIKRNAESWTNSHVCNDLEEKTKKFFKLINTDCVIHEIEQCTIHISDAQCELIPQTIHRDDLRDDYWTALWYLQGDGDTIIYDEKIDDDDPRLNYMDGFYDITQSWKPIHRSSPEPGKLLIFPSDLYHEPGFCTEGTRVVINFVFKISNMLDNYNESLSIASVPE